MLVLKRRPGESIIVNEQMRIVVLDSSNGGCRLAFEAPLTDTIRREEVPPREEHVLLPVSTGRRVPK